MNNIKLTIGCILGQVDEDYQQKLSKGISEYCRQKNISLIYYSGRPLNIPNKFQAQCNIIFDLINPDIVDGLIIFTCAIGNYVSSEELHKFLSRYRELPCVSISMKIDKMHSIIADNKKGMYDAVIHIIEKHDTKRIAFIRGPESNFEAQERFSAYKSALKEKNIPYDPDLIISGTFLEHDGIEAVKTLLDERNVVFEALVASNDEMALGALLELQKRGYIIPDDIIIIGFDDLLKSDISNPPLTTIQQPFHQLGRKASDIIFKLINKEEVPKLEILPTKLIIRRSCGCFQTSISQASVDEVLNSTPFEDELMELEYEVLIKIQKTIKSKNTTTEIKNIKELNHTFLKEIKNNQENLFLEQFDKILSESALTESDLNKWNDIISEFRRHYLPYIISNKELLIRSENIWHKSRIVIGEAIKRIQSFKHYLNDKRLWFFLSAIESFMVAHETSNLMKTIVQEIPMLGIKTCYLSLYEKTDKTISKWSRMILHFNDEMLYEVNMKPLKNRFLSNKLVPPDLMPKTRRYEWVVEALRSKDEKQYGFIVLEPKENMIVHFSNISLYISAALEEAFRFEERENLMENLANSNAELEKFAYIVSHDLKSPLHTIAGFLELLKHKFTSNLDPEAIEIIDLCIKSGKKMTNFIMSLLKYASLSTEVGPFKKIDSNQIIKDVLVNLKLSIDKTKAMITYVQLPIVLGDETQLTQLFQNLIDNAIKFHGINPPKIHINIEENDKEWIFSVTDNGIGIDPKDYKIIFKIFQRLHSEKEYPGTGIGLAFCKKILEHHNGRIWIESKLKIGSTFYFSLPKNKF